jgi:DNA-binding CsgD family transcriptional regulator
VLTAVHTVSTIDDPDDFGAVVLDALDGLIPSDLSSYNEVDPIAGRAVIVGRPDVVITADQVADWERWSPQHPVLMHVSRTGDGSARRLSDFVTPDELHRLELYTYVYAPLGVEYQLSVALPAPSPLVLGIALNRCREDFTGDEVRVLDAMRPHLVQAYRRAQLMREQRAALRRLAGALSEDGRALHVMGLPFDGPAATLAERHFGPVVDGALPAQLGAWVEAEQRAFASGSLDRLRQPLTSVHGGRRLTVRFLPERDGEPDVLAFDERVAEHDAVPLRRLGLSEREAQTLWWLTKGATTQGIATELGLSVGTVKKHLEHVYRKLGVSTRTAAVAQAFDALATP